MILVRGLLLVACGILASSKETIKQQQQQLSPIIEARSVPEYVLKYAYDHVESPTDGSKFVSEQHSGSEEEAKRITQTNTVFFKHKIIPLHYPDYSFFDYSGGKVPPSVVTQKEHPIIRPEVKIVPFAGEKPIEDQEKDVKLVHFHFPDAKSLSHYPSPVHYFEDFSHPSHLEKEILDKEIVHPFPIEKTIPFELVYPLGEEEKLTLPLKEEIRQEILNSSAVARKENQLAENIAVEKTIVNPAQSQHSTTTTQENPSTEGKEVPGIYPIQLNIPVKQLGKDVQLTPFIIKIELPKEEGEASGETSPLKKSEPTKE